MIRIPAILLLLPVLATASELPDLLRFTNGDQLRGSFGGLRDGPQALWKNEDLAEPASFRTDRIRHIVMRGGRPLRLLESLSHADLVNGDKVPGTITALDGKSVTLDTGYAGKLTVPRDHVTMLAPNPLGGRIAYYGPFAEDDWKMIDLDHPDGLPAVDAATEDDEEAKQPDRWSFSGSAWYWNQKKGGTALIREDGMPELSVLRFDLAWKNRLNLSIALHADFARPEPGEKEDDEREHRGSITNTASLPQLFGNSYVLQLYSNYLTLLRTSVGEDGKPNVERPRMNGGAARLSETGRARIELRSNRRTGEITLFVNDEFTAQWNGIEMDDGEKPACFGTGFGFLPQGSDSPFRISDIVMSDWNGMPDSARSLQLDDLDMVLMTNGTDRYSGKVVALDEDGAILFEGKHGKFRFPLEDVAEIRFARQGLASTGEAPADNVVVRFAPIGAITGQPVPAEGPSIGLISPILGRMDVATDSAVMIEFNATSTPFDDWNADF